MASPVPYLAHGPVRLGSKTHWLRGRLASVAAGFFTTLGIYLTGRELKDWKLGAWAAFFYVGCPFALWYDRIAIIEGLLLTFFVFVLYFAFRAARSLAFWWIAVLGPALGLALLTKGTSQLLFVIVPFAYPPARNTAVVKENAPFSGGQ